MTKPRSFAERLMGMSDRVWARHSNPWSVWTRFTILPLMALAVWSRVWLGWWALIPIGVVVVWTWVNPRAFRVPDRTDNWASKVVLGEQLYLTRRGDVAPHHLRAAFWLGWLSVPGVMVMAWGLWALWWDWTAFGVVSIMMSKTWFCDRMVWIYEDLAPQKEA